MRDRDTKNHPTNREVPNLRPRTFLDYAVALGTSVFIFFTCVLFINQNPSTPFDEFSHFDYIDKVAGFDLPKINELMSQRTLESAACSGAREGAAWTALEPCGSTNFNPRNAPWAGQNTATPYLATYYAFTAIPYNLFKISSTSSLDYLRSARLANSIWLMLTSFLLVLILRRKNYSSLLSTGLSIAFCVIPSQLSQVVTVSPDAAALFFSIFAIFLSQELSLKLSPLKLTVIWGLLTFLGLSIKLTTAPGILLAAIMFAQRFKKGSVRNWVIFRGLFLGIFLTGLLQASQPGLRGVAEASAMEPVLQSTPKQLIETMWGSIYYVWLPYDQIGWGALNNTFAKYLVFFFALATPLLAMYYYGMASHELEIQGKAVKSKKQFRNVDFRHILLTIFGVLILYGPIQTLTGYLFSGAAFFQPRYFMSASASSLLCLLVLIKREKGVVFFLYFLVLLSLAFLSLSINRF